jgi:hypothetical protein
MLLAGLLIPLGAAGRLGLVRRVSLPRESGLLLCLLASSLALFFLAHALLFRLYLPTRQVQFSLPIVWALGGGVAIVLLANRLARLLGRSLRPPIALLLVLAATFTLAANPPPSGNFYATGRHTRLYDYLQSLPLDALVAALPEDSGELPLFGQRPVFVSYEHALPYHLGYYELLRRRTESLLAVYFSDSALPLVELAEREGIHLFLANLDRLEEYREAHPGSRPALERLAERCGVLRERDLVVIPVNCARVLA